MRDLDASTNRPDSSNCESSWVCLQSYLLHQQLIFHAEHKYVYSLQDNIKETEIIEDQIDSW